MLVLLSSTSHSAFASYSLILSGTYLIGLFLPLVADENVEWDLFGDGMEDLFGDDTKDDFGDECLWFLYWPPQPPLVVMIFIELMFLF